MAAPAAPAQEEAPAEPGQ